MKSSALKFRSLSTKKTLVFITKLSRTDLKLIVRADIYLRCSGRESILQIDKFFHICNVFKVWPGSFLNERGLEIPVLKGYEEALVVRNQSGIRIMNPEEKELAGMRRTIALATHSSDPVEALQKESEQALDSRLRQERAKHDRSRQRYAKRIETLEAQVDAKDEIIADLR